RHTRWPRDWSSDVCSSDLRSHFKVAFCSDMPLYKGCARAAQLRARVASTLIRAAVPGCRSITSSTSWTSQSAIEYGSVQRTFRKQMNPPPAEIGVPVAEVETPALIIDLD